MKTLHVAAALLALGLTACTQRELTEVDNSTPVAAQVNASITGTEARASGTSWDEGDAIGLYCISNGGTNFMNVPYTITNIATGAFVSTSPIYFQDLEEVTFSAYYPYDPEGNYIIGKIITAADQTPEGQKRIDYLFASGAKASKNSPEVHFVRTSDTEDHRFQHCMTQLRLVFKQGDDTDLTNMTDFTISGLWMEGMFIPWNGYTELTGPSASDLTIPVTPEDSKEYTRELILFPQGFPADGIGLSLTLGGQAYKATLPQPDGHARLEAGKQCTYTITVNKTALVVKESSIAPWDDSVNGETDAYM